ncbi:MAG: hypothetical protein U0798_17850 [Gemmataceae bacterium]
MKKTTPDKCTDVSRAIKEFIDFLSIKIVLELDQQPREIVVDSSGKPLLNQQKLPYSEIKGNFSKGT